MRQSIIFYLISTTILWYFIPTDSQTQPEFCATDSFDGVFYTGNKLTFKSGQWYWQLDSNVRRMMPYVHQSRAMPITTLYIDRVPDCGLIKDCDQLKKALNMLFIRIANPDTYIETTFVGRVEINNKISQVLHDVELPWALTNPHFIWPSDWDSSPNSPKASLFYARIDYPFLNDVFFITNNKEYSELHSTAITSSDWYKRMNRKRLLSNVTFVGMFHTIGEITAIISLRQNAVYAVGHHNNDPNNVSKLFWLTNDLRFEYDVSSVPINIMMGRE